MNDCIVINVLDLIEAIGEDKVHDILFDFSCPKNNEIEHFVKENAIDFSKRKISVTHLVFNENGELSGIFTLTHKALEISNSKLSGTSRRKIERYAQLNESSDSYIISAFLIAQFGKNYNSSANNNFSGDVLMENAMKILCRVQRDIGGGVIYLECEDKPKLLSFYQNKRNCFRVFGERDSAVDGKHYIQLLRFF